MQNHKAFAKAIVSHMSFFLNRQDAARLVVNKAAYANSEKPSAEEQAVMKAERRSRCSVS